MRSTCWPSGYFNALPGDWGWKFLGRVQLLDKPGFVFFLCFLASLKGLWGNICSRLLQQILDNMLIVVSIEYSEWQAYSTALEFHSNHTKAKHSVVTQLSIGRVKPPSSSAPPRNAYHSGLAFLNKDTGERCGLEIVSCVGSLERSHCLQPQTVVLPQSKADRDRYLY